MSRRATLIELRDYLVYVIARLLICVLQTTSLRLCELFARAFAVLVTDWIPIRKQVLTENLTIAFPQWTAEQRRTCILGMWRHLILMLAEMAHARRKLHRTNWRSVVGVRNLRGMMTLLLEPRPKVIVSGHYGNFELAAYLLGVYGFEAYAVARTLDNPYLDRWLNDFRSAQGQHLIEKDGTAVEIAILLEKGSTLMLLADQNAGPKGCWVEFFGKAASTHKAIGLFSLGNDAPLGVSYARRLDGPLKYELGLEARFDPRESATPMDVTDVTRWFTDKLETIIRTEPDQYWWLHRRWKDERPVRVRKPKPAQPIVEIPPGTTSDSA
ncbi:MAG: lysophospholipid acyltransferase family protein [Pirellulales bacterium]